MPETDRIPIYTQDLDYLVESYRYHKQTADKWAELADRAKAKIIELMEANELDLYMQGDVKAVQIIRTTPIRFDQTAFRKAYPDIAQQYEVVSKPQIRVLIK